MKNALSFDVAADKSGEPKWNQLFVLGRFFRQDFPKGIEFTTEVFESMVSNWVASGRPELAVDYFHWGASHITDVPIEGKVASGWITDVRINNGALEGLIKWTDKARRLIESGELRRFSPYFSMNAMNRTTGKEQGPTLMGGALLNDPFLESLPAVAASAVPPNAEPTGKTKEQEMNPKLKKAVCMAFGIAEDSTDEQIEMAALNWGTRVSPKQMSNGINTEALALAIEPVKQALAEANTKAIELTKKVEALESEKRDAQVVALAAKLVAEGRVVAAQRDIVAKMVAAVGIDEASKYFAAMPALDMKERGVPGKSESTPQDAVKAFSAAVSAAATEQNISRTQAHEFVMRTQPQLAAAAFGASK